MNTNGYYKNTTKIKHAAHCKCFTCHPDQLDIPKLLQDLISINKSILVEFKKINNKSIPLKGKIK